MMDVSLRLFRLVACFSSGDFKYWGQFSLVLQFSVLGFLQSYIYCLNVIVIPLALATLHLYIPKSTTYKVSKSFKTNHFVGYLKAVDTIGNCQRLAFTVGVS